MLELVRGNLVEQDVDAIVNAANEGLWAGGGVCGAIHDAAGPELEKECMAIVAKSGKVATGSARITKGHRLKARHVIHAVGPRYSGRPEDALRLASAYRESMRLAKQNGLRSIAFPSISTGIFGYPLDEAARIAIETVTEEMRATGITIVRFVLFDSRTYDAYRAALG